MDKYFAEIEDLKVLLDRALDGDFEYISIYVDAKEFTKEELTIALARAMDETIAAARAELPVIKYTTKYFKSLIDTAKCSVCGSNEDVAYCRARGRVLCTNCCGQCPTEANGGCSYK